MKPAVVTAVLLLGVLLLCAVGDGKKMSMCDLCRNYRPKPCTQGFVRLDANRCMMYFWRKRAFYDAQRACKRFKGTLVSIHNKEQNNLVTCLAFNKWLLAPSGDTRGIWIGGARYYSQANYHFVDGSKFDYNNWSYRMPRRGNRSRRCIESIYGGWRNSNCKEPQRYVCTRRE